MRNDAAFEEIRYEVDKIVNEVKNEDMSYQMTLLSKEPIGQGVPDYHFKPTAAPNWQIKPLKR